MGSNERDKRGKKRKMQAHLRGMAARRGRDAGGKQRQKGEPQSDAMPLTRIEPYRLPRPTIREVMEGRPAGADDGGIPPKGYLGRTPKLAYRTEDRAQAGRRVRACEKQPWRGEEQRSAYSAGGQH